MGYDAVAVRYAERDTTHSAGFYRWESYGEPDAPLGMAYYFWVLMPRGDGAPIVVDSGFDVETGRRMGRTPLCHPGAALERLGVDPGAVEQVIITHLHYDHIGNLDLFDGARFFVGRREFAFWTQEPVARREHFAEHTYPAGLELLVAAERQGRVELVDDGAQVADGVRILDLGGHSPGQLAVVVEGDAPVVLTSDAAHYYRELVDERPFAVFADLGDVYRAYDRLRAIEHATLVPGHDPEVMRRFSPHPAASDVAVLLTPSQESQ
jgi:glyoxylase-like metal-dependent hydrolase (beta-lactamase superfamily II)